MTDLCKQAKAESKSGSSSLIAKNGKKATKVINLDYADSICTKLFALRHHEKLASRTKFKI